MACRTSEARANGIGGDLQLWIQYLGQTLLEDRGMVPRGALLRPKIHPGFYDSYLVGFEHLQEPHFNSAKSN